MAYHTWKINLHSLDQEALRKFVQICLANNALFWQSGSNGGYNQPLPEFQSFEFLGLDDRDQDRIFNISMSIAEQMGMELDIE